jgi:hypothetical protein
MSAAQNSVPEPVYKNGIAEDLGAILGYSAATRLMALYGGQKIYIPQNPDSAHRLAKLLGTSGFFALCEEFGGDLIKIPSNVEFDRICLIRAVAEMIQTGRRINDIAATLGMSMRQVANYRVQAEQLGILPMVLRGNG